MSQESANGEGNSGVGPMPFVHDAITVALPDKYWDAKTVPALNEQTGMVEVYSYKSVRTLMTDTRNFSQNYGVLNDPETSLQFRVPWAFDNPEHGGLRRLLGKAFDFKKIERFTPDIGIISDVLIGKIQEENQGQTVGQFEAVSTVGRLSSLVIRRVLGLPLDNETGAAVAGWMKACEEAPPTSPPDLSEAEALLNDVIEARKRSPLQENEPLDTLIGFEGNAEIAPGITWERTETIGQLWGILFAGTRTTQDGIGNMLYAVGRNQLANTLTDDPSLIAPAITETDRLYPPFPQVPVFAIANVALDGVSISPGQMVNGWIPSANRDPEFFAEPHTFDLRRTYARGEGPLTFAVGAHTCIGKELAKLERSILLERMLRQLPNMQLVEGEPVESEGNFILGPTKLVMAYDGQPR